MLKYNYYDVVVYGTGEAPTGLIAQQAGSEVVAVTWNDVPSGDGLYWLAVNSTDICTGEAVTSPPHIVGVQPGVHMIWLLYLTESWSVGELGPVEVAVRGERRKQH